MPAVPHNIATLKADMTVLFVVIFIKHSPVVLFRTLSQMPVGVQGSLFH